MPIEKHAVSHRFGIFTEARRNELVYTATTASRDNFRNPENPSAKTEKDKTPPPRKIEQMVDLLNSSITEIELLSLEDEVFSLLQKIKFQLSNVCKNGLSDLQECWSDLALFISCRSRKLQYNALGLLQRSLCDAPLSKSLLPTLLNVGTANIQEFLKEDGTYIWEKRTYLLAEVVYLICSRLYYHHLVLDLNEIEEAGKIERLRLLNKALSEIIPRYQDSPVLQNMLRVTNHMITAICPAPMNREPQTDTIINNEVNKSQARAEIQVNDNTRTERTNSVYVERPPLASFLWYCLKLWKSASRQVELEQDTVDRLLSTDFSSINSGHVQWLDYILAFNTLCECSKLKIEYLRIFLRLKTRMCPKVNQRTFTLQKSDEHSSNKNKLNLDLTIVYLKCLADVSMFGISTATQKLALLGNDKLYGLTDYLTTPDDDDEESLKIRLCAYQLLNDAYSFYQSDPMKDGLKNVAWNGIMKFKSSDSNQIVVNISQSYQVRDIDPHHSTLSIFSKISTNLCIMAFSPGSIPCDNSRNLIADSKRRPKTSKCFEKETELKSTTPKKVQTPRSENKSREVECWSEIQRIAEEHFTKELKQDEIEKEILRRQMLEEENIVSA